LRILTSVPWASTVCPASRAERGTFVSASPGGSVTSSVSPAGSRSSASFVRTHVIGHRRALTSSEWVTSATVATGMARTAYLILHGYQGSGPGHWQSWLAGRLRSGEASVHFPDLPDADQPHLPAWLEVLAREMDQFAVPPVVICHSAACVLWLHHVARGGKPAERVLLVAPPSLAGVPEPLEHFFPAPEVELDNARLVCAENDPYCPEGAADVYRGLPTDLLSGQGHINPDAGYGPWLAVEAWAREGTTPLTAREP
jgi:predicted alpha/beta hydrolase family esterase